MTASFLLSRHFYDQNSEQLVAKNEVDKTLFMVKKTMCLSAFASYMLSFLTCLHFFTFFTCPSFFFVPLFSCVRYVPSFFTCLKCLHLFTCLTCFQFITCPTYFHLFYVPSFFHASCVHRHMGENFLEGQS